MKFHGFFHQGGWETDETAEEAACREAYEEAGVRGDLKVLFLALTLTKNFVKCCFVHINKCNIDNM